MRNLTSILDSLVETYNNKETINFIDLRDLENIVRETEQPTEPKTEEVNEILELYTKEQIANGGFNEAVEELMDFGLSHEEAVTEVKNYFNLTSTEQPKQETEMKEDKTEPMAKSLAQVNKKLKPLNVYLVKGEGYFYVASDDEQMGLFLAGLYTTSIPVCHLNHQTVSRWVSDVKDILMKEQPKQETEMKEDKTEQTKPIVNEILNYEKLGKRAIVYQIIPFAVEEIWYEAVILSGSNIVQRFSFTYDGQYIIRNEDLYKEEVTNPSDWMILHAKDEVHEYIKEIMS